MENETLYKNYLMGAFPLVCIDTLEEKRAFKMVEACVQSINKELASNKYEASEALITQGFTLYEWDGYNGLVSSTGSKVEGTFGIRKLLDWVLARNSPAVVVIYDFHNLFIDRVVNATLIPQFKTVCREIPTRNIQIVGIGNIDQIPVELKDYIAYLDFGYPSSDVLYHHIYKVLFDEDSGYLSSLKWQDKDKKKLVKEAALASVGMTLNETLSAVKLSVVSPNTNKKRPVDFDVIYEHKARNITSAGLLEYVEVTEDIYSLGGMDNFKTWITDYIENIFRNPEEAVKFGLKFPKGVILTGVQGTGKSLAAKWLSKKLGVKLYRLDFGRIFGSLLGESERNMRTVLKQLKVISPAVLLLDEIEKALAGQESSGITDGGTTARLISSFLYDTQESNDLCFKVATCNDVFKLAPELLRKGRWSEIWFFDTPTPAEIEEIYAIHIKASGREPRKYDLKRLASLSQGFIGAEVENAVQSALRKAFTMRGELSNELLIQEIQNTKPLTILKADEISRLREWAKDKTQLANRKITPTVHKAPSTVVVPVMKMSNKTN